MDSFEKGRMKFPWGKLILFCTLLALIVLQFMPAPINRTMEVNAASTEVPGSTTVTLQMHQDGSVTWKRPAQHG
jgi:hypothetical protein